MQRIIFFLFAPMFFVISAKAQIAGGDVTYLASYKEELPYFQELITGGQYVEARKTIEGHPFYFSRQFGDGRLIINGITYPGVPLMYDIYKDQVITFHPIYNQRILTNPDKIDEFSLSNGERFKYLEGNENYSNNLNGLYQVLNEGENLVLVKRFKTTKSNRDISIYTDEFVEKKDFFIWKSGVFTQINKSSQAFEVLGLEKKAANKYLKERKIRFQDTPEKYLITLVELASQNILTQNK